MSSDVEKITAMLGDAAVEKRVAAAIVLGEIRAKGADVIDGLLRVALNDVPTLQVHALDALAKVGPRRVAEKLFPLLAARDAAVRTAAAHAIASVGSDIVPAIRKRLESAPPDERRGLDAILAELGGRDAFTTLLKGLATSDPQAISEATLAVRLHLKEAAKAERKSALAHTEKFLAAQEKAGGTPAARAAAIKILGYLAEPASLSTVLGYVTDARQPVLVRQEAVIALRFVMPESGAARDKAIAALIDCASGDDRTVAEAAMLTLTPIPLSEAHGAKLRRLIEHPEFDRARMVIQKLGQQNDLDAAKLLVLVLGRAEKRRADIAAELLKGRDEAAAPLAKMMLETADPDRRWTLRNTLRPIAAKVPPALRKELLEAALERLESGDRGWEAFLDVAQAADPKATAEALRSVAAQLRKKSPDKALAALSVLGKSEHATDEDRWGRVTLELGHSTRDLSPAARANDDALKRISALNDQGFDIVGRLRKDKSADLEHVYYLGFHFSEKRDPIGTELLEIVADRGGRTKIGKMAKSKLALAKAR